MSTPEVPLMKRINFRLVAFLIIVSALPLGAVYAIINYQLHGGVEQGKDALIVDLQALGNFPFDQNSGTINDVPSRWRALDGKRVQLRGFMWAPNYAGPDVREFQFVYNITRCCFSGPPQVQERVFARVPGGKRVRFYDFCTLTGILHVNVEGGDGKVATVYTLDVEKAEPDGVSLGTMWGTVIAVAACALGFAAWPRC